jgi:hypothetical protein
VRRLCAGAYFLNYEYMVSRFTSYAELIILLAADINNGALQIPSAGSYYMKPVTSVATLGAAHRYAAGGAGQVGARS